jgi:ribosomal protein S18 acetylase RimI-like enzyme
VLEIGPLLAPESAAAVAVLAHAFRDNPLNRAALGARDEAARVRANAAGLRATLATARAHGRVLVARAGGEPLGVLIGVPPGAWPLPAPPLWLRLRALFGQGLDVARRWSEAFEALAAEHPLGPRWYLSTLGVAPEHQRRGIGAALLAAWLAEVDRDGAVAYLETDRSENLGFYRRAGFEEIGRSRVLGVPLWRMERRAGWRSGAARA